jgi:hypothetical protein
MNTAQLISSLKSERDKIDAALRALEGLDGTPARKPGKVAGKAVAGTKGQTKPKRKISAAARKKMSEAAKARWAARKRIGKKAL